MSTNELADAILAEWDFCAEGPSEATKEARANGMSDADVCKALALAGEEWARCKSEVRRG